MKSKFSRILGVGITLTILATLIVIASPSAPASAATLGSSSEFNPVFSAVTGDVVSYAVAKDGVTIYAVQGNKNFNPCAVINYSEPSVRKSTNGGASWTTLGNAPDEVTTHWYIPGLYGTNGLGASIFNVAVAPDDANTIAILATDTSTGAARTGVYYSSNGGTTWSVYTDLNPIVDTNSGTTPGIGGAVANSQPDFQDLAVSPAVNGAHYLMVAGMSTTGKPGVWYRAIGGLFGGSWIDATQTNAVTGWNSGNFTSVAAGNSGAAFAAMFSPNFAGDFTVALVTGPTVNTANDTVKLQLASINSKVWNQALYPGWAMGQTVATLTGGGVVNAASLALDPSYIGYSSSKLAYVGLATTGVDVNGNPIGGVYRFTDWLNAQLEVGVPIYTVGLNNGGTNLVAGLQHQRSLSSGGSLDSSRSCGLCSHEHL